MDTITHIVIGGCVGEAIAGKKIGKSAMLIGAFTSIIPDLDVVSQLWLPTDQGLLAHRGFTHSFVFSILLAVLLALLFRSKRKMSFNYWFLFFFAELFLHIFIDAFNAYGTGWFEPFSHYRVSFQTIFVVDPFLTVWPGIAFIFLVILGRDSHRRRWWRQFGLGIGTLYFSYCIVNKIKTATDVAEMLHHQNVNYKSYFATPTPLNNWLWYVVANVDSGFYTGYYSVFDSKKQINLHYFPQNKFLLQPIEHQRNVQNLVRFSKGFYTVEKLENSLVFNDLRFGQVVGWYNPQEKFVFHYFLQSTAGNRLVVQRGRFAKWDMAVIQSLVRRIKGY